LSTVPSSVTQELKNQNIDYQVTSLHTTQRSNRARATVLKDEQGQIQAIFPENRLLDLSAINSLLGRDLKVSDLQELQTLYDRYKLQNIPALPKMAGMLTIVDESLLQADQLLLECGVNGQVLSVAQPDFKQTLTDVHVAAISSALKEDSFGDEEMRISEAVKNFTQRRVAQRLEETLELPTLPETAQRIINLRVDPNADISDLASIVELDPSLAAQVVSWASSPYYSAPGKIKSIHDAIVRVLGFDMVLNLALGLALGKTLNMPVESPQGSTSYWHQAVFTAATVEALVTKIPREKRPAFGMAYLSGLLSNFGNMVLAEVFPPHYGEICRLQDANPHLHYQYSDRHCLQISRDQLCAWLMELWNMPEEVLVALRHQGNPTVEGENSEYAKLIYIARSLLAEHNLTQGPKLVIEDSVWEDLHLSPEDAQLAIIGVVESNEDLQNIVNELGKS
jgi:HD-like signal output (HDOD) protein/prolyl-tRNA editing enzyme YbaK/EbsC (Cys-tRNA(Pro) deacylase)